MRLVLRVFPQGKALLPYPVALSSHPLSSLGNTPVAPRPPCTALTLLVLEDAMPSNHYTDQPSKDPILLMGKQRPRAGHFYEV